MSGFEAFPLGSPDDLREKEKIQDVITKEMRRALDALETFDPRVPGEKVVKARRVHDLAVGLLNESQALYLNRKGGFGLSEEILPDGEHVRIGYREQRIREGVSAGQRIQSAVVVDRMTKIPGAKRNFRGARDGDPYRALRFGDTTDR